MIIKKLSIFIIAFFVFVNAAHTPAAFNAFIELLSEVPAVNKVLPASENGMKVINYSSFIQISKHHMGEICAGLYESLQANLVFFSSVKETIIKRIGATAFICAAFCDIMFVKTQNIVFSGKMFVASYDVLKESGKTNMLLLFILLQLIMLLLYALYKGNIPHASVNYNKINKARYQYRYRVFYLGVRNEH